MSRRAVLRARRVQQRSTAASSLVHACAFLDRLAGTLARAATFFVTWSSVIAWDWMACWQTFKDGQKVINAHQVRCRQQGDVLQIEAITRGTSVEDGGYLWRGEMRLWDNEILLGWYVATEQAVRSKGTMYFAIHQHGQTAAGRWVGLSHDGPIVTGWAAMAKTEEEVLRLMNDLKTRPKVPA